MVTKLNEEMIFKLIYANLLQKFMKPERFLIRTSTRFQPVKEKECEIMYNLYEINHINYVNCSDEIK